MSPADMVMSLPELIECALWIAGVILGILYLLSLGYTEAVAVMIGAG